ncbi:MAG: hypothetical protein ACREPW_04115 [Candidatus Binataceae bacterium]
MGETDVRVVYSDEHGMGSEQQEPITVITAIMLNMDTQWHSVQHDLDTIAHLRAVTMNEMIRPRQMD